MDDSIVILGRQPALGLAELESLYGASAVTPIGNYAARIGIMPCSIDFSRLGGSLKLCKVLTVMNTTTWHDVEKFLVQVAPGHSQTMPAGKMHLGLSSYGVGLSAKQLLASGLNIKKAISKQTGRTVRVVPNQEAALSSAQVIHNKLLTANGWELVIVRDGDTIIVAQTLSEQDIESYTLRDRGRPKRDARVGMLPPKLAQIIINLAAGIDELSSITVSETSKVCLSDTENAELRAKRTKRTVLDPFCGTGVLLQEAALMGYGAYGSDLEPRMVVYSQQNYQWLQQKFAIEARATLEVGDSTAFTWQAPFQFVASETYLGRPFTATPSMEVLVQTVSEVNLILKKFLQNIHDQVQADTRFCLAVPAWQEKPGIFRHLPLIDQLGDLGYNRVSFEHVRDEKLLYYREDQIVARELLVLTRK